MYAIGRNIFFSPAGIGFDIIIVSPVAPGFSDSKAFRAIELQQKSAGLQY
jgi:hypothetical protein